jgi:hypothetical protein
MKSIAGLVLAFSVVTFGAQAAERAIDKQAVIADLGGRSLGPTIPRTMPSVRWRRAERGAATRGSVAPRRSRDASVRWCP